jgi:predicted nucleotidyltransferase
MRLSEKKIGPIILGIEPFVQGHPAELVLFGSRTNDTLRGGDIDLALVLEETSLYDVLSRDSYKIVASIKMAMDDDERIDLLVTTRERISSDPFQKRALEGAITLCRWPR